MLMLIDSSCVGMAMCDMVFWWMVFLVVVRQIVASFIPEYSELVLKISTFEPVELHFE